MQAFSATYFCKHFITSTQILGTSGTVYTRPLLLPTWPLPRTCLPARRGLDTRLPVRLEEIILISILLFPENMPFITPIILALFVYN